MFELEKVSKSFADAGTRAVAEMDLSIASGRTTVFIGPSGCGKSTLIRILLGLIIPDSGTVSFEGDILTPQNSGMLRRKMGYVIQGGGLFPHLTARDNATLMARYLSWPADRIEQQLKTLTELTHLPPDALDRFPVQLSGGQRQRVALMRALMLDPDVLLLDEPFGALDPMVRYSLQTELRDIFRELDKTVVMVTHDIGEASYFGDTIVLLRDGHIVQMGGIAEFVDSPAEPYVEEFISAQRTLFDTLKEQRA